jgi:transposase
VTPQAAGKPGVHQKKGDTLKVSQTELGMPWKEEKALQQQRESLVKEAIRKEKPFRELCKEYQISRKTGYKWCKRSREEGSKALGDRRRGPREGSAQVIETRWQLLILEQKKSIRVGDRKSSLLA